MKIIVSCSPSPIIPVLFYITHAVSSQQLKHLTWSVSLYSSNVRKTKYSHQLLGHLYCSKMWKVVALSFKQSTTPVDMNFSVQAAAMLTLHETRCRRSDGVAVVCANLQGQHNEKSRDKAPPSNQSCHKDHYRLQTLLPCPHDMEISLSPSARLHPCRQGGLKCVL